MWWQKEVFWAAVESISTAMASIIAAIALLYVGKQLRESKKIARADFLLRLDEMFQEHTRVHVRLRNGGDWAKDPKRPTKGPENIEEWTAVEGYMGLFERIQVMINDGIVDLGTIYKLYGYRVFNIADNPVIRKAKLEDRAKYWKDFIELWHALEDYRKKSDEKDSRKQTT
jgi:hypothetical protein